MSEFDTESSIVANLDPVACRKAQRVVAALSENVEECQRLLAMLGILNVLADAQHERSDTSAAKQGDAA